MSRSQFAILIGAALLVQSPLVSKSWAESLPTENADAADLASVSKLASDSYRAAFVEYLAGTAHNPEEMTYTWSKRWMEADIKRESSPAQKLDAAEAHLDRMRELARRNQGAHQGQGGNPAPLANTEYYEAEAKIIRDRMRRAVKTGTVPNPK